MNLWSSLKGLARHPRKVLDAGVWRTKFPSAPPDFDLTKGSASEEELEFLADLVQRTANIPGDIVEIGTLFGRTTIAIALAKSPSQRVVTVDNYGWNPWRLSSKQHKELTAHSLRYLTQTGHVSQVSSDKSDFYRMWNKGCPSLVFLDAIHTYEDTLQDINWALSIGARIICGHDFSDKFPGVQQAVVERGGVSETRGSVWVLNQTSSSVV